MGIAFGLLVLLMAAAYVGLAEYYRDGFSCGTWINGIYCTGKTVDEVNEELLQSCSYGGLVICDREGRSCRIEAGAIDFSFDFKQSLNACLEKQNPYRWIDNLFSAARRELTPVISYKEEKLLARLEELPAFSGERPEAERNVYVRKTRRGYELVNERADVLDQEKALLAVKRALKSFEEKVDLKETGCYRDLPLTEEMRAELDKWEKIREFQDCRIIYRFGEERVPVDASVVCDWIALDQEGGFRYSEDGSLMTDEEKIAEFIKRLADEYDTVGGVRHFQATRGEMVAVEGGTYGNRLDRKAETQYLSQAFREKRAELHTPVYTQKAWKQGKNDIGRTYIEVDMTTQKLYYYEEGEKKLETSIVTGNTGRRMGTPEGVNFVYGKQENRVLRGPGYASHVNFWMPVKGNIGIHDAAWRSEYGKEIYKTNGSHGCINTPYDAMSELYGMAKVGTPVVMFY